MATPGLEIQPVNRERAAVIIATNVVITSGIITTIFLTGTIVGDLNPVDLLFESLSAVAVFAIFVAAAMVKVAITSRPALLLGLFFFQLGRLLDVADEIITFDSMLWSVAGDALALVGEVTLAVIAFMFVRKAQEIFHHDGLTQLYNRAFHVRKLDEFLRATRRTRNQVAVIALDIDHFKHVNDAHGHAYGDVVLQHTARVLKQASMPGEIVSRTGGEEFEVLVPATDADNAGERAEAFRAALETNPPEKLEQLTASIGVALGDHQVSGIELRRHADEGAYQSKQSGRNRVTVHRAETTEVA